MTKEQQMVLEFHRAFNCKISKYPQPYDPKTSQLRKTLIEEELAELTEASEREDIVGIADALGDLLYIVYGAAVTAGIDLEPIFEEIHRSNMTKANPDGSVTYNKAGKVIKPASYSPADLEPIIANQLLQG